MDFANPYAAQASQVAESRKQRYYSPGQVLLAALVGGPLAGGYLISRDHSLFGSPKRAKATLVWSAVALICMLGLGYALPEHASRAIPSAILAGWYGWYAKRSFQGTIAQGRSQGWVRYSWWRVVALSAGFLLLMFALLVILVIWFPPADGAIYRG